MITKSRVVEALEALAHEARLDVFLTLVETGPQGLSAGALANELGIAPNALSFHLNRLRQADLVDSRREGQRVIYAARYDRVEALTDFLADRCCARAAAACTSGCQGRRAERASSDDRHHEEHQEVDNEASG
ncbi:MAG TPA: metalloregulator ArsR/SmtB family transcription factor [Gammaproteobacteria bacterium]|nr:metalloregulator ArsR/SmtB family transcription factor [Gammaproteobacteria bacterium]